MVQKNVLYLLKFFIVMFSITIKILREKPVFKKNVRAYKMFHLPFSTYCTYGLKSKLERVCEYPSGYCRDSEGIKL